MKVSIPSTVVSPLHNLRGVLGQGARMLEEAQIPSSRLAAELLLMHVLDCDRARLFTHPEESVPREAIERYFALIGRRMAGEPTQYLTGHQEFWGLDFEVNRDVLIPRPETEHLVEVALERLGSARLGAHIHIADVGTGSGCIAVALAKEFSGAQLFATDISVSALEVASRNAARHGVAERISFGQGNLLEPLVRLKGNPLVGRMDLVVSNPPYIGRGDAPALPREVREHEPSPALFGGEVGSEMYAPLIHQAAQALAPGGLLVLELGYDSLPAVRSLLESHTQWRDIRVAQDLSGIARVVSSIRE
jgi:release factor glutamine methyltransferase